MSHAYEVFFDPLEGESETVSTSDAYPLGDQLASNSGNVKYVPPTITRKLAAPFPVLCIS